MAKSTRSKVKRSFRRDKREAAASAYQATEAARLARLSAKLRAKFNDTPAAADNTETEMGDADGSEGPADAEQPFEMEDASNDGTAPPNKISTSGPRLSRRQEWRISKGMPARSNRPSTLNKQGTPQARRKAGRSHRRR